MIGIIGFGGYLPRLRLRLCHQRLLHALREAVGHGGEVGGEMRATGKGGEFFLRASGEKNRVSAGRKSLSEFSPDSTRGASDENIGHDQPYESAARGVV